MISHGLIRKLLNIVPREKHKAFKSGDKECVKSSKVTLKKVLKSKNEITRVRWNINWRIKYTYNIWKSLEQITGYKVNSSIIYMMISYCQLNLTEFDNTTEGQIHQPMLPFWPCSITPPFKTEEYEIKNVLRRQNSSRAYLYIICNFKVECLQYWLIY